MSLTNAERQSLWRERQKMKVATSQDADRLRAENNMLRKRVAELELRAAAHSATPQYPAPRCLSDLVGRYLDSMDPEDPGYPAFKDQALKRYRLIIDAAAPFAEECRQLDPRIAQELAMTLGLGSLRNG